MPMTERGESWGGFALSANRDLEDLGMDYSNQFSVYASDNTKFAVGYAFGDWGGEYGVPVIEFSNRYGWFPPRWPMRTRPITIVWRIRA